MLVTLMLCFHREITPRDLVVGLLVEAVSARDDDVAVSTTSATSQPFFSPGSTFFLQEGKRFGQNEKKGTATSSCSRVKGG